MKFLKIIGLAAMAAAAVMAVGAATSSATVFCKNNASTTTCSEPYKIGTVGVATLQSGTSFVLESAGGTIYNTCTGVKVEKEQTEETGATTTVVGTVAASDIHLEGCSSTVDVLEGGKGEVHWISGTDNGTGTATGGAVTTLITGVSCTYGLGSEMKDWGVLTGGKPGSLSVNNFAIKVAGSFLCPSEARAKGKLVLTSPEAGYVTSG
jgi:hypothetical protein